MTVSGVRVQQSPADPDGQYFPAKQEVCGPNGGAVPVNIGSATLSVTADGVEIKNDIGNPVPMVQGLSIPAHDWIGFTYTGTNLTGVQYRTGGASGTIVGTLTLAYSGSNLISVTKS